MKKTIAAIAILATVGATASFGQGTVLFGNNNGTRVSTNSVDGGAATGLVAAGTAQSFYYALFYSTTQTTVNGSTAAVAGTAGTYAFNVAGWNNGTPSVNLFSTNAAAGRLQTSSPNSDLSTSLTGLNGGTAANFVVVGWSANIGNSISALQAWLAAPGTSGWIGESVVSGSITTGTLGSTPGPGIFGSTGGLIPGFTLGIVSVPEPGTLALAALGGASLLMFRRKQSK